MKKLESLKLEKFENNKLQSLIELKGGNVRPGDKTVDWVGSKTSTDTVQNDLSWKDNAYVVDPAPTPTSYN